MVDESEFGHRALEVNLADRAWLDDWGTRHYRVIREVFADADILPFRFGTVSRTREGAVRLITEKKPSLELHLEAVSGGEQYVLHLRPKPGAPNPDPLPLSTPRGREATLELPPSLDFPGVRRRVLLHRGRGGQMEHQEALLVDRQLGPEFRRKARRWAGRLLEGGILLSLRGPSPPYEFSVDPARL